MEKLQGYTAKELMSIQCSDSLPKMQEISAETVCQWIPYDSSNPWNFQEPPKVGKYLITYKTKNRFLVSDGYWTGHGFTKKSSCYHKIVAWAQLPKPYKP